MTTIYEDGTYFKDNPSWHQEDASWKAEQILKIINSNGLTPETICEIGCGTGEVLFQLSRHLGDDKKFFGFDISPQAIALSADKARRNLIFEQRDIMQDSNLHYDLSLIIDVFEHVEDYFGFLRKVREKAIHKIFHIPLDLSVQGVLRTTPMLNARNKVGHIHYFTKETALATLRDTGYEVIDYFYTPGMLELRNRGWKANLLKLPRKLAYSMHKDLAVRVLGGFSLLVLAK